MTDKTLAEDLRGRGLSHNVIKLLEDYGVGNANEIAFFSEDNFRELRSKGLRDFQETQLKHIQKQLQPAEPEKTSQEGASCMTNMDKANRNVSANTINTLNISDQAPDEDDASDITVIEFAERQILERLKSSLEDVAKSIEHICTEYTRLDKVPVDPHTWDQLFKIMEEKKRLKPTNVVSLQILLWKVKENSLFELITGTADAWFQTYRLKIVFLRTKPDAKGQEKVKFHLCVAKADFSEDKQLIWMSRIAFLLMVDVRQIEIENVEFGGSAWVTVTMPAVLSEALQKQCQDPSFQSGLNALLVDRISFMTSSGEQTIHISATMDTSDHEECKHSAKSGPSLFAVDPSPVHWKEDATRHLLKLFLSDDAGICPQTDLQPFTPAVTEAITMGLTSLYQRVREYRELCAHHVLFNKKPDVQTTSSILVETERSIQFYVEERLSVWKKQSQDLVDAPLPVFEDLHLDDADDVHLQALDQCFPTLARDMRVKGTTLVDDLVADDVISVTSTTSILNKATDRQVNEEVLKAVRGLSAQQFHTSFLPALKREEGNALLAQQLTSTIRRLQEDARSQSQRACGVCVLRDRVDPRRVADQLLARGLIPRCLYDDLRVKTLSTDEAWERIFLHVGHTEELMPILSRKYAAVHAEMLEKGISSLECRCRRLSRGLVDDEAVSEGDVTNISQLSDFSVFDFDDPSRRGSLGTDDVISVTSSILSKCTDKEVNKGTPNVVRFLPDLEGDEEMSLPAKQLTSTKKRLQEDAGPQSQRACDACVLRDRVDPCHLADLLLAGGLIPRGLYDDLRAKTLSTDEAWKRIFLRVGHTQKLMPILSRKYPAVHAEMLEKDISSLECSCRRLSRGPVGVAKARSEADLSDIARLSDFTSPRQKGKLSLPEYRMTSSKRGYCFLVVNTIYKDREVSRLKREQLMRSYAALQDLFRRLGFDLIERENLSASQLKKEARKVAHMDHSASDCLAVVLLSLPGPRDGLLCSDGPCVTLRNMRKLFSASHCPSLAGKPKLLYRPWSRGHCSQGGVTRTDKNGITHAVPDDADFLEIETCPPQCMTARISGNNALTHIELLASVLEGYGHEEDFLSCLALTNSKMARKTMKGEFFFTAPFHSTLTKKLKFPLLK